MSSVEFNEQRLDQASPGIRGSLGRSSTPGITGWFVRVGLAASEKTATNLMIILTTVFFLISIYLFFFF